MFKPMKPLHPQNLAKMVVEARKSWLGGGYRQGFLHRVQRRVLDVMATAVPMASREVLAEKWGLVSKACAAETQPQLARTTQPQSGDPVKPALVQQHVEHEVYGKLLADLVYKKVYLAKLGNLLTVPVWKKQRILRLERSERIAEAVKTNNMLLPGVITIFEMTGEAGGSAESQSAIIDGQHRRAALALLAEQQLWDYSVHNVTVDVFPVSSEKDVASLFTDINQAEPVKLVDFPFEAGGAVDGVKEILNSATQALQRKFPGMFKPSQRCRIPHVNIDNLRDLLHQGDVVRRHSIESSDDLLQWLLYANDVLAQKPQVYWDIVASSSTSNRVSFAKALEKCHSHNFYLGLCTAWTRQ